MNYLSGGNVNKPASLESVLQKQSAEHVLMSLAKVFPDMKIIGTTNRQEYPISSCSDRLDAIASKEVA